MSKTAKFITIILWLTFIWFGSSIGDRIEKKTEDRLYKQKIEELEKEMAFLGIKADTVGEMADENFQAIENLECSCPIEEVK